MLPNSNLCDIWLYKELGTFPRNTLAEQTNLKATVTVWLWMESPLHNASYRQSPTSASQWLNVMQPTTSLCPTMSFYLCDVPKFLSAQVEFDCGLNLATAWHWSTTSLNLWSETYLISLKEACMSCLIVWAKKNAKWETKDQADIVCLRGKTTW